MAIYTSQTKLTRYRMFNIGVYGSVPLSLVNYCETMKKMP